MPAHYTFVAKLLHWVMAVLIIGMLAMGLKMTSLPMGPDKLWVIGLHKSTGIVILFLAAFRLYWRLKHVPPALPDSLSTLMKRAAKAGHHAIYAMMFIMPLSGWAMSSAAGFPVSVYGWFLMPNIMPPSKPLRSFFGETHELVAYLLIITLVGHILAALWHHYVHKDDVLRRMWFGKPRA